jgi:hypothetical protein
MEFDANIIEDPLLSGEELTSDDVFVDVTSGARDCSLLGRVEIDIKAGVVYTKVVVERLSGVD